MGSPERPSPEQYAQLERASELGLLGSPEWVYPHDRRLTLKFTLPRQAVSLLVIEPAVR
jgi:xylan 1,4-beta-xylosidase